MSDSSESDRLLNIVGVVLVLGVLVALGVVILVGITAPDSAEGAPQVEWSVERINDTHVRLAHQGGETVSANLLIVTVDRVRRHPTWSGVLDDGDSGVVRAERNTLIRLYWESGAGKRVSLEHWRVD